MSAHRGPVGFPLDFVDKAAVVIVHLAKNHLLPDGITVVILRITRDSWRTIRGHEH